MSIRVRPVITTDKTITPTPADSTLNGGKLLLTGKQLAAQLGVSLRLVEKWSSTKIIPKLVISPRMTRYQLHKVLAALEQYETATLR